MLVTIVAVGRPDGLGLDLDRLEKVEDLPAEIAQKMLDGGTGRKPSEAELAAYHAAQHTKDDAAPKHATDTPSAPRVTADLGEEPKPVAGHPAE